MAPAVSRYLADCIPGARFVAFAGEDHSDCAPGHVSRAARLRHKAADRQRRTRRRTRYAPATVSNTPNASSTECDAAGAGDGIHSAACSAQTPSRTSTNWQPPSPQRLVQSASSVPEARTLSHTRDGPDEQGPHTQQYPSRPSCAVDNRGVKSWIVTIAATAKTIMPIPNTRVIQSPFPLRPVYTKFPE